MRFSSGAGRAITVPMLGLALAAAITACSSSSSSPPPAAAPSTASTAATAGSSTAGTGTGSSAATTAAIDSMWVKFFAASTSTSQRVAMLQNGQKFATALGAMSAMGSQSSVKVTSPASLKSPTTATLKYTIYLGKTPMLPNVTGTAVYSGGKWLVSDSSVCQLLTLENAGKAPAVCSSAS